MSTINCGLSVGKSRLYIPQHEDFTAKGKRAELIFSMTKEKIGFPELLTFEDERKQVVLSIDPYLNFYFTAISIGIGNDESISLAKVGWENTNEEIVDEILRVCSESVHHKLKSAEQRLSRVEGLVVKLSELWDAHLGFFPGSEGFESTKSHFESLNKPEKENAVDFGV